MPRILCLLATLALLAPAGRALADDDCLVPMEGWQPRAAVRNLATAKGWTLRRIKIDDGCYEVDGIDAAGRRIEVTLHPGTLAILEIEHGGEAEDHRQPRHNRDAGERERD